MIDPGIIISINYAMAGPKDKSKDKKKLTKRDAELWKTMTSDVRRMPGAAYDDGVDEDEILKPAPIRERPGIVFKNQPKAAKSKEVDRRTAERLARGKMKIEGTLDLHGMNQEEAWSALKRFIKSSHERGRRCVLVITGKGRGDKPGILKERVPEWLNQDPLNAFVLRAAQAKQQDGGQGAIYVLLRRSRG